MKIEFDLVKLEEEDDMYLFNVSSRGLIIGTLALDKEKIYDTSKCKSITLTI